MLKVDIISAFEIETERQTCITERRREADRQRDRETDIHPCTLLLP